MRQLKPLKIPFPPPDADFPKRILIQKGLEFFPSFRTSVYWTTCLIRWKQIAMKTKDKCNEKRDNIQTLFLLLMSTATTVGTILSLSYLVGRMQMKTRMLTSYAASTVIGADKADINHSL